MAELAWCSACQEWRNLELRQAVCDEAGNLVCQKCGTVIEEAE